MDALLVIQDARAAESALNPLRLRILERLGEPASASSMAAEMALPRQIVNYHLRELESAGMVRFVEERRKGNCLERIYEATARTYVLAPAILAGLAPRPHEIADRASREYMIGLGARLIQEVSDLAADRPTPTLSLETQICFESADHRLAFARDLAKSLADLTARYHSDAGAETYRVLLAVHPLPETK